MDVSTNPSSADLWKRLEGVRQASDSAWRARIRYEQENLDTSQAYQGYSFNNNNNSDYNNNNTTALSENNNNSNRYPNNSMNRSNNTTSTKQNNNNTTIHNHSSYPTGRLGQLFQEHQIKQHQYADPNASSTSGVFSSHHQQQNVAAPGPCENCEQYEKDIENLEISLVAEIRARDARISQLEESLTVVDAERADARNQLSRELSSLDSTQRQLIAETSRCTELMSSLTQTELELDAVVRQCAVMEARLSQQNSIALPFFKQQLFAVEIAQRDTIRTRAQCTLATLFVEFQHLLAEASHHVAIEKANRVIKEANDNNNSNSSSSSNNQQQQQQQPRQSPGKRPHFTASTASSRGGVSPAKNQRAASSTDSSGKQNRQVTKKDPIPLQDPAKKVELQIPKELFQPADASFDVDDDEVDTDEEEHHTVDENNNNNNKRSSSLNTSLQSNNNSTTTRPPLSSKSNTSSAKSLHLINETNRLRRQLQDSEAQLEAERQSSLHRVRRSNANAAQRLAIVVSSELMQAKKSFMDLMFEQHRAGLKECHFMRKMLLNSLKKEKSESSSNIPKQPEVQNTNNDEVITSPLKDDDREMKVLRVMMIRARDEAETLRTKVSDLEKQLLDAERSNSSVNDSKENGNGQESGQVTDLTVDDIQKLEDTINDLRKQIVEQESTAKKSNVVALTKENQLCQTEESSFADAQSRQALGTMAAEVSGVRMMLRNLLSRQAQHEQSVFDGVSELKSSVTQALITADDRLKAAASHPAIPPPPPPSTPPEQSLMITNNSTTTSTSQQQNSAHQQQQPQAPPPVPVVRKTPSSYIPQIPPQVQVPPKANSSQSPDRPPASQAQQQQQQQVVNTNQSKSTPPVAAGATTTSQQKPQTSSLPAKQRQQQQQPPKPKAPVHNFDDSDEDQPDQQHNNPDEDDEEEEWYEEEVEEEEEEPQHQQQQQQKPPVPINNLSQLKQQQQQQQQQKPKDTKISRDDLSKLEQMSRMFDQQKLDFKKQQEQEREEARKQEMLKKMQHQQQLAKMQQQQNQALMRGSSVGAGGQPQQQGGSRISVQSTRQGSGQQSQQQQQAPKLYVPPKRSY